MNNPNSPNYGPQNVNQPYPPHQSPQKPKWSTKKKIGVGAAIVLGIGVIGGAIGGGTSGNSDNDKKPAISAQVEDHADYEVEQQRTTAPVPEQTVDDIFVEVLRDKGFPQPRQVLIDAAQNGVCGLADNGISFGDLVSVVMDSAGLHAGDAGYFIGASIGAYCPEHEGLIETASGRGI